MIENFKTETFDKEVLQSHQPVLVDFWAPWCVHCRVLNPVLEEFAETAKDIRIGKVNIDEEPKLAEQYQIKSIPTVLLIKDGAVSAKKTAPQDPEELEDMLF